MSSPYRWSNNRVSAEHVDMNGSHPRFFLRNAARGPLQGPVPYAPAWFSLVFVFLGSDFLLHVQLLQLSQTLYKRRIDFYSSISKSLQCQHNTAPTEDEWEV